MADESFWRNEDAEKIAEELIPVYHPHLAPETGVRICYLYTNKAKKRGGKVVMGSAKVATPVEQFLSQVKDEDTGREELGYRYILTFPFDEFTALRPEHQRALVDHYLTYCTYEVKESGEMSYIIRLHDFEGFTSILERYGAWNYGLQKMGETFVQAKLFEEIAAHG